MIQRWGSGDNRRPPSEPSSRPGLRMVWVAGLIALAFFLAFMTQSRGLGSSVTEIDFSSFSQRIKNGQIKFVTISGATAEWQEDQLKFRTVLPPYSQYEVTKILETKGSRIKIIDGNPSGFFLLLLNFGPLILFVGLGMFMLRRMLGRNAQEVLDFSKSQAKLLKKTEEEVTFQDVASVEEAKEELAEVVEFLKEPGKFQRLGARLPKGVLLIGPPGTGKTLLARAVAGEANVPFFSISGSDFVQMFVGVGASRVRDLFKQGEKNAPCIIFIDEIDAVGRHRGAGLGGGHDEREQTLNQLLVEMDGFESNTGVIIIAASNRPDILDPALLRPGRFDRQVVVSLPDIKGREAILKVHARKLPLLDPGVDLLKVARGTPGFSGAALANLVNEAALNATRYNRSGILAIDFEEARDKVLMGKERKSFVMTEKDKKITAYHEAGHALVAYHTPGADPLHKVTIIPRGLALGLTQQLPEQDKTNYSKDFLEGQIAILMGGRCAEKIFLYTETTGAAHDLEMATDQARRMVTEWGMSKLGLAVFGKAERHVFLGREMAQHRDFSEDTAQAIDREIKSVLAQGRQQAEAILKAHSAELIRLAGALLEFETLEAEEIKRIIEQSDL